MSLSSAFSALALAVALFALGHGLVSAPNPVVSTTPSDTAAWEARVAALEEKLAEFTAASPVLGELPPEVAMKLSEVGAARSSEAAERAFAGVRRAAEEARAIEMESPTSERNLKRTRAALVSLQKEALEQRIGQWVDQERVAGEQQVAAVVETFSLGGRDAARVREIFAAEEETRLTLLTDLWGGDSPTNRDEQAALGEAWDWAVEEMKSARATRDAALAETLGSDWETRLAAATAKSSSN